MRATPPAPPVTQGLADALGTAVDGLGGLIAGAGDGGQEDEAGADAVAAAIRAAVDAHHSERAAAAALAHGSAVEGRMTARNDPGTAVVLVADDSEAIRAGLRDELTAQSMRVVVAVDGLDAMTCAAVERPDLVLLDVELSGIDGHEVLRRMKDDPELADIPVVFLTGRTGTADIVEGLRLGAHDYLPKPFEPAELTARVRAALRVKALQDQLRDLGRVDGLTGIANRRHLDEQLRALCSAASRHGHRIAVALFDLDHFKAVNDRFGHPAGDQALRAAAELLRNGLRIEDVVGRWGGEEFLVVLPSTDSEGAAVIADRLRSLLAATPVVLDDGTSLSLTCSVGCAAWDGEGGIEPERLVALADSALYRAKSEGRDRVGVAPNP